MVTEIRMRDLCVFWLTILERGLEEWENNIFFAPDYSGIFSALLFIPSHCLSQHPQEIQCNIICKTIHDTVSVYLEMLILSGCPFLKSTTPRLVPSPSHTLYPRCWGLTVASVRWALCRGVRLWGCFVAFQFKDPKVMWESWDCEGQECCIVPEQGWEDMGGLRVWWNTSVKEGKPCVVSCTLLKCRHPSS